MVLRQEPIPRITDPRRYLTAIHADAGVGKTSFAVQIPGHYFLITEAGIEGIEPTGDYILSWKDFLDKGRELIEAKRAGFPDQRVIEALVVDTLDNLFDYACTEVITTQTFLEKGRPVKYAKIEDVPFGKGFKEAAKLLIRNLETFRLNGFGVILLGHTKERVIKWAGQDLSRAGFNLPPSASALLEAACGAIGQFVVEERTERDAQGNLVTRELGRYQYWQPTMTRLAKHRLENFPEKLALPLNGGWRVYEEAFQATLAKLDT